LFVQGDSVREFSGLLGHETSTGETVVFVEQYTQMAMNFKEKLDKLTSITNTSASLEDVLLMKQWQGKDIGTIRDELLRSVEAHEVRHKFDKQLGYNYDKQTSEMSAQLASLGVGPSPFYDLWDQISRAKNYLERKRGGEHAVAAVRITQRYLEKLGIEFDLFGATLKDFDELLKGAAGEKIKELTEQDIRNYAEQIYNAEFNNNTLRIGTYANGAIPKRAEVQHEDIYRMSKKVPINFNGEQYESIKIEIGTPKATLEISWQESGYYNLKINDNKEKRNIGLYNISYFVGRNNENQIQFSDGSVSRTHLKIKATDWGIEIQDLGSANGIKVILDASKKIQSKAGAIGGKFSVNSETGEVEGLSGERIGDKLVFKAFGQTGKIVASIGITQIKQEEKQVVNGILSGLRDFRNNNDEHLTDKDSPVIDEIVETLRKNIERGTVYLMDDNPIVSAFANKDGIYFTKALFKMFEEKGSEWVGLIAFFHEAGEITDLSGLGSKVANHLILRGCGKDVRIAMDEVLKSSQLGDFKEANDFIKAVDAKLRGQYKRKITPSEQKLIEAQFQQAKEKAEANGSVDFLREAAYGLQDRLFGEKMNREFTENIRIIRDTQKAIETPFTTMPLATEEKQEQRYEISGPLDETGIINNINQLKEDINKDKGDKVDNYIELAEVAEKLNKAKAANIFIGAMGITDKDNNLKEKTYNILVDNNFSNIGNITKQLAKDADIRSKGIKVNEERVMGSLGIALLFAGYDHNVSEAKAESKNYLEGVLGEFGEDEIPQKLLQQARVCIMLGKIYKAENNKEKMMNVFEQADGILEKTAIDDKKLLSQMRFELGMLSAGMGDFENALKHFKAIEALNINTGELQYNIGIMEAQQARKEVDESKSTQLMESAKKRFGNVIRMLSKDNPFTSNAYLNIASLLTWQGKIREAFEILDDGRKAIGENNIDDSYRMQLAVFEFLNSKSDKTGEDNVATDTVENLLMKYGVISTEDYKDNKDKISAKANEAVSLIWTRKFEEQRRQVDKNSKISLTDASGFVKPSVSGRIVEGFLELYDSETEEGIAAIPIDRELDRVLTGGMVERIRTRVTDRLLKGTIESGVAQDILGKVTISALGTRLYEIYNTKDIHMASDIMAAVLNNSNKGTIYELNVNNRNNVLGFGGNDALCLVGGVWDSKFGDIGVFSAAAAAYYKKKQIGTIDYKAEDFAEVDGARKEVREVLASLPNETKTLLGNLYKQDQNTGKEETLTTIIAVLNAQLPPDAKLTNREKALIKHNLEQRYEIKEILYGILDKVFGEKLNLEFKEFMQALKTKVVEQNKTMVASGITKEPGVSKVAPESKFLPESIVINGEEIGVETLMDTIQGLVSPAIFY
ncbi:MAG: FHA domain-containing protein, partial [Candidatus Omnitrophica bacterium]|nr:FHA domain-containing protein [Candidatus Omnitrophota bacterium]